MQNMLYLHKDSQGQAEQVAASQLPFAYDVGPWSPSMACKDAEMLGASLTVPWAN